MELKHTKGEYEIVKHNWSDTSIVSGDRTICRFDLSDCYDEDANPTELLGEIEANIKLVRSSKDLLEALIELVKWDKKYPQGGELNPIQLEKAEFEYLVLINNAKTAIQKATS
jgi:hypothetical protein